MTIPVGAPLTYTLRTRVRLRRSPKRAHETTKPHLRATPSVPGPSLTACVCRRHRCLAHQDQLLDTKVSSLRLHASCVLSGGSQSCTTDEKYDAHHKRCMGVARPINGMREYRPQPLSEISAIKLEQEATARPRPHQRYSHSHLDPGNIMTLYSRRSQLHKKIRSLYTQPKNRRVLSESLSVVGRPRHPPLLVFLHKIRRFPLLTSSQNAQRQQTPSTCPNTSSAVAPLPLAAPLPPTSALAAPSGFVPRPPSPPLRAT